MSHETNRIEALRKQIIAAEEGLINLKADLARIEAHERTIEWQSAAEPNLPLTSEEYQRYGRQMIVPDIGIQGQSRLKSASVLIVGVGGLGCPAAAYLAGAGIGVLGLVDGDNVELSNLHRQVLHNSSTIGMTKVDSALAFLQRLNPHLTYQAHRTHLTAQNCQEIVSQYDMVLDCTDHPTSRYLVSDICSLLQKPLLSASALRYEGQLMLLNWPPLPAGNQNGGPCYRCVFPKAPPADSVVSCGDGGIVGPVVGVIGVLQALETLHLITSGKLIPPKLEEERKGTTMLLFSAHPILKFRNVKLKGRREDCITCSNAAKLSLSRIRDGQIDYMLFCGSKQPQTTNLDAEDRIEVIEYARLKEQDMEHILLDVREKVQFDICNLVGSINLPFSTFQKEYSHFKENARTARLPTSLPVDASIYVICRMGNDSQVVTKQLKARGLQTVKNITGGFKAWREQVDPSWPDY